MPEAEKDLIEYWEQVYHEILNELFSTYESNKRKLAERGPVLKIAQQIAQGWSLNTQTTGEWSDNQQKQIYAREATIGCAFDSGTHGKVGVYLRLGHNDSLKECLAYLASKRIDFNLEKVSVSESTAEYEPFDVTYHSKEHSQGLIVRIWVENSGRCERVQDGTQPKYKIVCS